MVFLIAKIQILNIMEHKQLFVEYKYYKKKTQIFFEIFKNRLSKNIQTRHNSYPVKLNCNPI